MACGDRVYFQSKRKKAHVSPISKKEVVDLVKEFFGDIAPEVKRLDIDPDGLRFEIVFIPSETKKVIIADTIEPKFGSRGFRYCRIANEPVAFPVTDFVRSET